MDWGYVLGTDRGGTLANTVDIFFRYKLPTSIYCNNDTYNSLSRYLIILKSIDHTRAAWHTHMLASESLNFFEFEFRVRVSSFSIRVNSSCSEILFTQDLCNRADCSRARNACCCFLVTQISYIYNITEK